jgi:hypothetical protein
MPDSEQPSTNTRHKLNEANYFLHRMRETATDDVLFRYHLSAFLSAARSVWEIMENDPAFTAKPGFRAWCKQEHHAFLTNKTFQALEGQRDVSSHIQPVSARVYHHLVYVTDHLTLSDSIVVSATGLNATIVSSEPRNEDVQTPPSEVTIDRRWCFEKRRLSGMDVVDVCQQYLEQCEQSVERAEALPSA